MMKNWIPIVVFSLGSIGFWHCVTPPDYPKEPKIEFISLSKSTLKQGELGNEDSLFVNFSFTDGDGDLGSQDSFDVFFIDLRDNTEAERFRLPKIPEKGSGNGVIGTAKLTLPTTCCRGILPPCKPSRLKPVDTLVYEFYVRDRAGNLSNRVKTSPIFLQCQ